jgi:hypothetical protein
MWENALEAKLDDETTIYVSPIDDVLYRSHVEEDNLGGRQGYFIMRNVRRDGADRFDVLAKAVTLDTAEALFELIVGRPQRWG